MHNFSYWWDLEIYISESLKASRCFPRTDKAKRQSVGEVL